MQLSMQGALGELTFESEAAERLRAEVRAERASLRSQTDRLQEALVSVDGTCLLTVSISCLQASQSEHSSSRMPVKSILHKYVGRRIVFLEVRVQDMS